MNNNSILDVAILGAGPGGLSAAARAAHRRISHLVLEASDKHANTIQRYQRLKHVMAEPGMLPLRSDIAFKAGTREEILETWERNIAERGIRVQYGAEVVGVTGRKGDFQVKLKSGRGVRARHIVLAIGVQGNPRKLGVPGDNLPCVLNTLDSAADHKNEAIVIVGAGDSAIEDALALARQNRVVLVNRGANFGRAKEANSAQMLKAIRNGVVECLYESQVKRIDPCTTGGARARVTVQTPEGVRTLDCHMVITRLGAVPARKFVESIGVRFASPDPDALPDLTPNFESSVPGLYVIGALAGFPLIKQAMNQGYEVIEHMLGNKVQPADEAILQQKLNGLRIGGGRVGVDQALRAIQMRVRLFRDMKPLALRELAMVSRIFSVRGGTVLFKAGDYSTSVFNVLDGEVHLYTGRQRIMTLKRGQVFGEISLISGRPHEVTAVAGEHCVVLESPQAVVKKLMRVEPSVREYLDKTYILRALKLFLLSHASAETIHRLAETAKIHRVAAGDTLFEEGDPVDRLYLLRSGSMTLSRKAGDRDVIVAYCAAGKFVDLVGCQSGALARTVTARATVACEALSIDYVSFCDLQAEDKWLEQQVQRESKEQLAQYTQMRAAPEASKLMSFMLEHGLGEATNVLVIDEQLCVGCDQCETACASTHDGVSRLDRKAGPSLYSLHLPTSCRHCEHPHCMKDCPPNAIHRMPNGEVFIDDTCIGCGNCEANCPYGVIQMAEVDKGPSLLQRLLGRKPSDGAKTAVKCDMCKDVKSGPACVAACPTGAAIRIHAEDVPKLARTRAVEA
ncbi:MAG TPA: NAD(P)-binding domain-containing protein [Steroidobacteraceae bacterium]|nr:NAD(P)-binding domain-containing protein [Steroidobacteraceae bacterium]